MVQYLQKYKFRILAVVILTCISYYSFAYNRTVFIFFALANAILIESILLCFCRNRILFFCISFLISIFMAIEVFYVTAYSSRIAFGTIGSIFETNSNEAVNMISSLSQYLIVFVVVLLGLIFLFANIRKEHFKSPIPFKYLVLSFLISISVITLKTIRYVTSTDYIFTTFKSDLKNYPLLAFNEYFFHWTPSFFCSFTLSIGYFQELYKFKQQASVDQIFPVEIYKDNASFIRMPRTVVLVIGESSNRDNYSLYGYTTKTTPFLDSLFVKQKLLHYEAVSSSSITRNAVPLILTFGTVFDPTAQNTEQSIITMANNLGYQTYWISNQDKSGMYDSTIGYLSAKSENEIFSNDHDSEKREDLNLIKEVKKYYRKDKNQFFIIHLRGSHQSYKNGYDDIDMSQISSGSINSENIDYDRTIHHTDRVLSELYNCFFVNMGEEDRRVLFYTSDHGEIVNTGHGLLDDNMDQYKIPFIVLTDSTYLKEVDASINEYVKNDLFNISNFPYIFSGLIGYKVKDEQIEKAKHEGLYYMRIDRKILKFPDNL